MTEASTVLSRAGDGCWPLRNYHGAMMRRDATPPGAGQPPRPDIGRLLVSIARDHFARDGYVGTSLASVVAAAGITKGAVYYHFTNKRDLFAAVYVEEQRRVMREVSAAYGRETDVWAAFHAGMLAFLRELVDRGVQRVLLIDAPVALGWTQLRDGSTVTAVEMIAEGLRRVARAGLLDGWDIDVLAHLIYGAICESAHLVALSEEPEKTVERVAGELRALLDTLVAVGARPSTVGMLAGR